MAEGAAGPAPATVIAVYMDHDSSTRSVASGIRARDVDVLTTREAGNQRQDDEAQLGFAAGSGRAIYTANVRDFVRLHAEWLAAGRPHAGIIVRFDQRMAVGQQVLKLADLCRRLEPEDLRNALIYLDGWELP